MRVFTLTFVRHGETTANRDGIIQGHRDVPLSEVGLKQAEQVAARLQNDRFTHIFSSDLSRASQTAQAIAKANCAFKGSLQLDKRLRERTFGIYEGKQFTELDEEAKQHNKAWRDYTPKDAETYHEVRLRARSFFQDLCAAMAKLDCASHHGAVSYPEAVVNQPAPSRHEKATESHGTSFSRNSTGNIKTGSDRNPSAAKRLSAPQTSQGTMSPLCSECKAKDAAHASETVGNVLVVSHGGLIKEMLTYFVEDLNCEIPGGRQRALQTSPNTGVSRFIVTLSDQSLLPIVRCECINDDGHLQETVKKLLRAL